MKHLVLSKNNCMKLQNPCLMFMIYVDMNNTYSKNLREKVNKKFCSNKENQFCQVYLSFTSNFKDKEIFSKKRLRRFLSWSQLYSIS